MRDGPPINGGTNTFSGITKSNNPPPATTSDRGAAPAYRVH
jgi:hypothetical protein